MTLGASLANRGDGYHRDELRLLEALHESPEQSQRELAKQAGLSLSKAHLVLKRLAQRGMVTVKTTPASGHRLGYRYQLTPRGHARKALLRYRLLQRTAEEYQDAVRRLKTRVREAWRQHKPASRRGPPAILLVGSGALSDLVRDVVQRAGMPVVDDAARADLAIVLDPREADSVDSRLAKVGLG